MLPCPMSASWGCTGRGQWVKTVPVRMGHRVGTVLQCPHGQVFLLRSFLCVCPMDGVWDLLV